MRYLNTVYEKILKCTACFVPTFLWRRKVSSAWTPQCRSRIDRTGCFSCPSIFYLSDLPRWLFNHTTFLARPEKLSPMAHLDASSLSIAFFLGVVYFLSWVGVQVFMLVSCELLSCIQLAVTYAWAVRCWWGLMLCVTGTWRAEHTVAHYPLLRRYPLSPTSWTIARRFGRQFTVFAETTVPAVCKGNEVATATIPVGAIGECSPSFDLHNPLVSCPIFQTCSAQTNWLERWK